MNLISERARLLIIIAAFNMKVIFGTAMDQKKRDNFNLTTEEIIKKYGYPAEVHKTESEDGYHLVLHRIPHGKNSTKPGLPILAAHGIFSDSSQFVQHGNESLGFFLADKGFDVWLINFRGNHFTRTHKYLSPEDSKFWDFSLHEHGVYDLPAYINYICNYTKNQELFFLGYSMGSTAFLVLGSEKPEYQKHIKGALLLAPVATVKYSKFPLSVLATFGSILKVLSDIKSHGEFHIDFDAYQKFVEFSCPSTSPVSKFCEHAFFALTSGAFTKVDEGRFSKVPTHYPSSTSTKVIAHYAQLIQSGIFRQFDYGILHNLVVYNRMVPPEYNLHAITTPISVFVAPNDILATPKGVKKTLDVLTSVETIYVVPDKYFGHGNFISEKENKKVLFPEIIRQIENLLHGGNASQENHLINTYRRVHGNEIYHTEDCFNSTPTKIHGSARDSTEHSFIDSHKTINDREYDPTGHSFINTHNRKNIQFRGSGGVPLKPFFIKNHKKIYGKENYPVADFVIKTLLQVYGSGKALLKDSFIKTPQQVHGDENYPTEDSFINPTVKVHGSGKDPLENSFIDNPKNVHSEEKYATENSAINTLLQIYGSEGELLEDSSIKTPQQVHGDENYPTEDSFINPAVKVHDSERDPLENSFIDNPKNVHSEEKYAMEDSVINTLLQIYRSQKDHLQDSFIKTPQNVHSIENYPAEDSFINTHKTVHDSENDPAKIDLKHFKNAHGRKKDHAGHLINNNFRNAHVRRNEEHYMPIQYFY